MNTTPETATTDTEWAFYSAHELAEKLKVNVMTIYRYIKAGKLTAYKFGKEFRITEENFQIFLNNSISK